MSKRRILGWVLIFAGIFLLGGDSLRSLETGALHIASLAENWADFAPQSYASLLALPQGWPKTLALAPLRLPAFAPFVIIGLWLLIRPRKKRHIFKR